MKTYSGKTLTVPIANIKGIFYRIFSFCFESTLFVKILTTKVIQTCPDTQQGQLG